MAPVLTLVEPLEKQAELLEPLSEQIEELKEQLKTVLYGRRDALVAELSAKEVPLEEERRCVDFRRRYRVVVNCYVFVESINTFTERFTEHVLPRQH